MNEGLIKDNEWMKLRLKKNELMKFKLKMMSEGKKWRCWMKLKMKKRLI